MALFFDLAPTHLILFSTLSISMTPPSLIVDRPSIYDIDRPLFHSHYMCQILFAISSTHTPTNIFKKSPPTQKTLTNAHAICLGLYLSHTHPRRWGTCMKRRGACTGQILPSLSQPHPRRYTVEHVSVRKGSPRGNLTCALVVHLMENHVPRVNKQIAT